MSYSLDLRQQLVAFIKAGGSPTTATKIFNIGRATIYRWLHRDNLAPTKVKHRQRKVDLDALAKDVQEYPDDRLVDRAQRFGGRPSTIHYALQKLKITRKKRVTLPRT